MMVGLQKKKHGSIKSTDQQIWPEFDCEFSLISFTPAENDYWNIIEHELNTKASSLCVY